MDTTLLIFPNQLFIEHKGLEPAPDEVILIEDSLFFLDDRYSVNFHKQKLIYHRASMKAYQDYLVSQGFNTVYLDWRPDVLSQYLQSIKKRKFVIMDPVDQILHRRIEKLCNQNQHSLNWLDSQLFFNTAADNKSYCESNNRWFMVKFYKHQRNRLNILIENDGEPAGGKWSYDSENRKKIPLKKRHLIPTIKPPQINQHVEQARQYVQDSFPNAVGNDAIFYYPVTHAQAQIWLEQFLTQRFAEFGIYQDALVPGENWLYHSMLSPLLNSGLLTPDQIVSAALKYAKNKDIPLSSLEGFVRQIIGWREFMRATYCDLGVRMRTGNYWQHHARMPISFYNATTGIEPIDDVITRILNTGYCHHIERLMVLGGFMFLCEIEPDEIYKWFMGFFIDAYDWVMVPNVYAMSQNADGGMITTKPYFSGSAYLKKMGYNNSGDWCQIWDGLYWRWIWKHRLQLKSNPRWAMMCAMVEKMDEKKRNAHLQHAENYLTSIFKSKK